MEVLFISNYFNHHQKHFSDVISKIVQQYKFAETTIMDEERKKMGWNYINYPEYVQSGGLTRNGVLGADALICGSAPYKWMVLRNIHRKLTFRYSERQFKEVKPRWKYPYYFVLWHILYPRKASIYLLCASAYAYADYVKLGVFNQKGYKWGYYPELYTYDVDTLMKQKNNREILWCGRLIDLKRVDLALEMAKQLRNDGIDFVLKIIGSGEKEDYVKEFITTNMLSDRIVLLGNVNPKEVRRHMEHAGVFVFTSDRNEGWGVVLNEAMNSGCAVIASHAIGSVPFLIDNEINGMVFESGNLDELTYKTRVVLTETTLQQNIGRNAYYTIKNEWNAEIAATRFKQLVEHILAGEENPELFEKGPLSTASIIEDDWYLDAVDSNDDYFEWCIK